MGVVGAQRVEREEGGQRVISIWPAGWQGRGKVRRGKAELLVVGRTLGKGEGRGGDDNMVVMGC